MKIELLYNPKTKATIDFVLYFVSYYYVILASINDGVTGVLCGIPFAIFLVVDIVRKNSFYRYLSISVLVLSCVLYFSDRSAWTLTYPMVGNTFEVTESIKYRPQGQWLPIVGKYADDKYSAETFEPGTKIKIVKQIFSGNPDFGVAYEYHIDIESDGIIERYGIGGLMLRTIYESQNMEYREDRFQNLLARYLIFFTHMFFFYPVILIVFISSVFIRGKASENKSQSTFIAKREA